MDTLAFNTIDVETANANRASICQIGIVHVRDGEVKRSVANSINPKDWFDPWNIAVVFEKLQARLSGAILVSHTLFDRVAVERAMTHEDIKQQKRAYPGAHKHHFRDAFERIYHFSVTPDIKINLDEECG